MERLKKLKDPRRTDRGNIRHRLEDIIIIGLCTLICNGEDFLDMEEFGKGREEWLSIMVPRNQTGNRKKIVNMVE